MSRRKDGKPSKPRKNRIRELIDLLVIPKSCNGNPEIEEFARYLDSIRSEEVLEEMLYDPGGCADILASLVSIFMLGLKKRRDTASFKKAYDKLSAEVPENEERDGYLRRVQEFINAAEDFVSSAEENPSADEVYGYVDNQFSDVVSWSEEIGKPVEEAQKTYDRQAKALDGFLSAVREVEKYYGHLKSRFTKAGHQRESDDYGRAATAVKIRG